MDTKKMRTMSKFLSLVLRHKPETIDIQLDKQGWIAVETLLEKVNQQNQDWQLDFALLEYIVVNNDKKRFAFNADKTKIRASQGHSLGLDLDLEYEPQMPPAILYHGTGESNVASILAKGIEKRERQYVHLSRDIDTAVVVAHRRQKPTLLQIEAGKMHSEGYIFYLSENKVWLTLYVPPQYIALYSVDESV
ncbi:MAG: RNA 2'-phosphotransferase [Cytophagales bacterium]|nr:MAG: RNA 2'-phosphotransferase [Cytophagales bacterium]